MPNPGHKRVLRLPPEDVYTIKKVEMGFESVLARKSVYMCLACRQVWTTRYHAESCEFRGHTPTLTQDYFHSWSSIPTAYTFEAIRREPLDAELQALPRHTSGMCERMGQEQAEIVRHTEGGFDVVFVTKYVYMCRGCRFVWALQEHALSCGERGHPEFIAQTYPATNSGKSYTHVYRPVRYEP